MASAFRQPSTSGSLFSDPTGQSSGLWLGMGDESLADSADVAYRGSTESWTDRYSNPISDATLYSSPATGSVSRTNSVTNILKKIFSYEKSPIYDIQHPGNKNPANTPALTPEELNVDQQGLPLPDSGSGLPPQQQLPPLPDDFFFDDYKYSREVQSMLRANLNPRAIFGVGSMADNPVQTDWEKSHSGQSMKLLEIILKFLGGVIGAVSSISAHQ